MTQGEVTGALASYRASLAIMDPLAKSNLGNTDWQRALAMNYNARRRASLTIQTTHWPRCDKDKRSWIAWRSCRRTTPAGGSAIR